MHHTNVFVEDLADLPLTIDEEVRQMLGIESWEDQVIALADEPHFNDTVAW